MGNIKLTGLISGLDTDSLIKELVNAQKLKNKKVSDKLNLSEWKEEKWKELNTKLYKLYTDNVSKMRLQSSYNTKAVTTTNTNVVDVTGDATTTLGAHSLKIISLASSQYSTSGEIKIGETKAKKSTTLGELGIAVDETISFTDATGTTETLTITNTHTINDVIETAKKAGLNASFDETQGRLFLSSKESGTANSFTFGGTADALEGLQLKTGVVKTQVAQDSEIEYNGATIKGDSNVVKINGLTLTLKGKTGVDEMTTLNVSNNVDATYNMVKDFIKSYNDILKEMNTLYYAESATGYAPLSDDEKAEMSDEQVEQWESKIKNSIMRRDTSLGTLISSMKQAMASNVQGTDGKNYSLSTFGIQTSIDYTEKGLLHIYGDADDSTYSDKSDKLKKALSEDPDTVINALSGISKNLYDTMFDKMKSIPNVSSALTFFNDKLLDKDQDTYKKRIAVLESKLTDLENRYYKQFSAMETAMAKLQSQSNALAGLLGNTTQ